MKMNNEFVLARPDGISDSSWEALCDALAFYAEEWDDSEDEEDED
jgi:hypothetical protein